MSQRREGGSVRGSARVSVRVRGSVRVSVRVRGSTRVSVRERESVVKEVEMEGEEKRREGRTYT
jgi:hypothetical protein